MKINFRVPLFIFVFLFCFFLLRLNAYEELPFFDPEITISMDFQDARLKDILKIFSIQSGLNFIASEAVQDRTVTLYLDKVPVKEAMDKLFKANNLTYELDKDASIFIVKDLGKPEIDTITKVFYLRYHSVSTSDLLKEKNDNLGSTTTGSTTTGSTTTGGDIVASIKEILTTNGKISEDKRTNSLIITDIPSRFPIIEKVLARLDVPQPQIMLEVEMLDVSKNLVDSLGFEFSSNPITLIMPGNFMRRGADFFLGTYTKRGLDITSSTSAGAVILGKTFGQALDFLRTQTDTKYLARPRLLTLNNETAEIKIATQESVGISTTTSETGGTTTNVERVETGVTLRVTPQVNVDTGEITMFLYPKVSEATGGNTITQGSNSYVYRDPEERSTKTMVRIKDGETVIVGGLIRNEFQQVTKKLPILGDLPIIGALFRHKGSTNDKNKERELLVFITPHILKDAYIELAQTKKGMLPEREQDALPAADRGKAINANLNSFEKNR